MRRTKPGIRLLAIAAAFACTLAALPAATGSAPAASAGAGPPPSFFGIVPQTALTERDVQYMRAGGIGSVRIPFAWSLIQPTPTGGYDWSSVDPAVDEAARGGLKVLPFLAGTPRWLSRESTRLPIDSGRARRAWVAFLKAAVERYGPGGEFWTEEPQTGGVGPQYETSPPRPVMPVRDWQVWNEANFFYFAYPVSPSRYARLLKLSAPAIRAADPRAKIVLSGLFGNPDETGKRGMDSDRFLDALYRSPGIKASFDAAALHPYAFHVEDLEELVEKVREVMVRHGDAGAGLYVTEMGWGSQNDPNQVAFEQGIRGQARELRGAYRYLIDNRHRLNLKGTYWFSWKDVADSCNFCDSVGLFRKGNRFKPKPAWRSFVALSGGRRRP